MATRERLAAEAIRKGMQALATRAVERQYCAQSGVWEKYGEAGRDKSLRDAAFHFQYLAEALDADDPALFLEYLGWAKVLFAGLRLPEGALEGSLRAMREAVEERLPDELRGGVTACLDLGLGHLVEAPSELATFLPCGAPLVELARAYLDALRQGDRQPASRLILEAADGGTPVRDLYLHVFQPCQHEIGRLWQMNQLSVAEEHYCTAATQLIMSQLYPRIFATERIGRRLVATCVADELHEIGLRMVADFFEMEGWDTYYLGGNVPAETVVRAVAERRADVLGISATIAYHVSAVTELIRVVKLSEAGRHVKLLVGGYPFNVAADLWRRVGADGFGRSAEEAVTAATGLLASHGA